MKFCLRKLFVLSFNLIVGICSVVWGYNANTRFTEFSFDGGQKNKQIILYGLGSGSVNFYLENRSNQTISGNFEAIDAIELTGGVRGCKSENEKEDFGRYATFSHNTFNILAGQTFTGTVNILFPQVYSGVHHGCIAYYPAGDENNGYANTKPRKAILLEATIHKVKIILDKPSNGDSISGGLVEFEWHPEGNGLLSGYQIEIYSGGMTWTGYQTSNTGTALDLVDGVYLWSIYPIYINGSTGQTTTGTFKLDTNGPNFIFKSNSGYICETGTLSILDADDGAGVGLDDVGYKFNDNPWSNRNVFDIYMDSVGIVYVSGFVRDLLGNISGGVAEYIFKDVPISASGISVPAWTGISFDRKDALNVTKGNCGNSVLSGKILSGGTIGSCEISWNIITYTPTSPDLTGSDSCTISIEDGNGNFVDVEIEFTNVNDYPSIQSLSPEDGKIMQEGNMVNLSWQTTGNIDLISGYVCKVRSTDNTFTRIVTGNNIQTEIPIGAYRWEVYIEYNNGFTGGLSEQHQFNIAKKHISGGGYSGGGGLTKDKCPGGDESPSYYDGTCSKSHGASDDICGINLSQYSDEQKGAYLYAYINKITTICPIYDADLDGYLIRSHFAKMISAFAMNVLDKKPEKGKIGCDKFKDLSGESQELKDYMKLSCELNLMGLESDGKMPMTSFKPNEFVTRAQFGTVLSRLLFGDKFNVEVKNIGQTRDKSFWYKKHLLALKEYGIMTKIDGDWPNHLEIRGLVMLMLHRANNYGIFAGKIPAQNGVSALLNG